MRDSLEAVYDTFAKTYEASRGLFDMSAVLTSLKARLPGGSSKLLDLGCGAGEPFGRFFCDHDWLVTGVDFSAEMLALAESYVPEMSRVKADIRDVEFGPNQFGLITAIYSLFHLPVADQSEVLAKCYRWLKPGGTLLFTYAGREYTGQDEFCGYKEFLGEMLFYSHRKPEQLIAELTSLGFVYVDLERRLIGGETFIWVTASKP